MEENNQNQEVMQGDPFANAPKVEEQRFTQMGQVNEPAPKKKKSKAGIVVAFVLLLLVAIVGGVAYYYYSQVYTNPKLVYQHILKTGISSLATETTEEITTLKTRNKLDLDIDLKHAEESVQKLLELINDVDATVEIQADTNTEKAVVKLDSNYKDEELLKADLLIDIKNEEAYLKAEQFFTDILKVEIEEVDFEDFKELLDSEQVTQEKLENTAKAIRILSEEFTKIIKDEYCSKEKEKITINSKEINADKYILKLKTSEFLTELTGVLENLKNNEVFLNCFEEKEEIKEQLESWTKEIKKMEVKEDIMMSVNLYRTGLKQKFVRVDFEAQDGENHIELKIEKIENKYAFELSSTEETYCKGTVLVENLDDKTTKIILTFEIEEVGTVEINTEFGYEINEPIDTMDTKNAVKAEEISDSEVLRVMANLQESKLYELIEEFSDISDEETDYEDDEYLNVELPDEDEPIKIPNDSTLTGLDKNISTRGEMAKSNKLVVFAKNSNKVAVDMDIEVEFYDENKTFLGSSTGYLTAVAKGNEIAIEMYNTPSNFTTYKIYVDAEETDVTQYFDKIEMTHNNNGENIAIQVENKSEDTIEFLSVAVVYYKDGKMVGIEDSTDLDVKPGRKGNFNIDFPYDSEYNDVEFDDYEVYVTEAYSYNY